MTGGCQLLAAALLLAVTAVRAQVSDVCELLESGSKELTLNKTNVHWGFFDNTLEPKLYVKSGDEVTIEMATHQACDDWDKMIGDDEGLRSIYDWETGIPFADRFATHILTGPIAVCGAEPGDVLQVEIMDLQPRPGPNGTSYGSNMGGFWGYQYRVLNREGEVWKAGERTGHEDEPDEEFIAIWRLSEENGTWFGELDYMFDYPSIIDPTGRVSTFRVKPGSCVAHTYEGFSAVPQEMGFDTVAPINYTKDAPPFRIKLNPHIGNMGLAPDYEGKVNSVPPMASGGNLDDKRIGPGTTMYYRVEVPGALLSLGDAHAAQGDSELDGTGVETSMTAKLKITLLKQNELPLWLVNMEQPIGETADEYIIHSFTRRNFLTELEDPNTDVFQVSNFDDVMANTLLTVRNFLMDRYGVAEHEAPDIISLGVNFGVTQVVDGNWGGHALVPKSIFPPYEGFKGFTIPEQEPGAGLEPVVVGPVDADTAEEGCAVPRGYKELPLTFDSVGAFGFWSKNIKPRLYVHSGDMVRFETATPLGCSDWDHISKGDPPMEAIFKRDGDGTPPLQKDGRMFPEHLGHVLTGPIYICDVAPGDIVKVEYLDMRPRVNPAGRMFGLSDGVFIGYQFRIPTRDGRTLVWPPTAELRSDSWGSLWEMKRDESGGYYAEPEHFYQYEVVTSPTNQTLYDFEWWCTPHNYPNSSGDVQSWGWSSKELEYLPPSVKVRIPLLPHFGCFGLAPETYPEGDDKINSIAPIGRVGGNMDERLWTVNTTVYLKAEVPGGLFSAGDGHAVQGASELDGTGLEVSLDGTAIFTVIKQGTPEYDKAMESLDAPLGETDTHWISLGLSVENYLEHFAANGEGADPFAALAAVTGYKPDEPDGGLEDGSGPEGRYGAVRNTYINARNFVMDKYNLSEKEALAALTVAGDIALTEVVDTNMAMHYKIDKGIFDGIVQQRRQ